MATKPKETLSVAGEFLSTEFLPRPRGRPPVPVEALQRRGTLHQYRHGHRSKEADAGFTIWAEVFAFDNGRAGVIFDTDPPQPNNRTTIKRLLRGLINHYGQLED